MSFNLDNGEVGAIGNKAAAMDFRTAAPSIFSTNAFLNFGTFS